VETAIISQLSRRLSARLRAGDPVARRIKLTKTDAVFSVLAALRYLP
jgi:farnesyl-diphosphate farnesyltransferase